MALEELLSTKAQGLFLAPSERQAEHHEYPKKEKYATWLLHLYALCNSLAEETVEHLFLNCPFAAHCWNMIQVDIPLQSSFPDIIDQIKD